MMSLIIKILNTVVNMNLNDSNATGDMKCDVVDVMHTDTTHCDAAIIDIEMALEKTEKFIGPRRFVVPLDKILRIDFPSVESEEFIKFQTEPNAKVINLNRSLALQSVLEIQENIFSRLKQNKTERPTMIDLSEYESHEIYRLHFYVMLGRLEHQKLENTAELKSVCDKIEEMQRVAHVTSLDLLYKIVEATNYKFRLVSAIEKLNKAIQITRVNAGIGINYKIEYLKIDL